MNSMAFNKASHQMLNNLGGSNYMSNQVVLQALNNQSRKYPPSTNNILSNLGSNSSVTIQASATLSITRCVMRSVIHKATCYTLQSVRGRNVSNRASSTPSISITPLPGRPGGSRPQGASPGGGGRTSATVAAINKPGYGGGKNRIVMCEICDGFIKDLEQLRNHMMWIHKVRIRAVGMYTYLQKTSFWHA